MGAEERRQGREGGRRGCWTLAAIGAAAWGFNLLVLMVVAPRFEQVFTDFGVVLPWLTTSCINTSRWLLGTASPDQAVAGIVMVLGAGVAGLATLAVMTRIERSRALGSALLTGLVMSAAIAFAAILLSLVLPMIVVQNSLAGGA